MEERPTKRRTHKRKPRQQLAAASDDGDDELDSEDDAYTTAEHFKRELAKLKQSQNSSSSLISSNQQQKAKRNKSARLTRLRSLNYWRRYRMRQLGLDWKLVELDGFRSLDLARTKQQQQQVVGSSDESELDYVDASAAVSLDYAPTNNNNNNPKLLYSGFRHERPMYGPYTSHL